MIIEISAYVKWALKADIRLLIEGFLPNEQNLWLQHLKKNVWLMDHLSSKPFSCCDWYYKAVSKRYWNRKVKPSEIYSSSPFGKLWTSNPDAPLKVAWLCKIRFPTTDVQQVVEDIYNWNCPIFSSWGLWFLFYSEHYAFRRHISVLCSHELQRSSVELSVVGVWQFESYLLGTAAGMQSSLWTFCGYGGWDAPLLTIRQGFLNIPCTHRKRQQEGP